MQHVSHRKSDEVAMSDIVTRLRAVPPQRTDANNRVLCAEAAAEIERLRDIIASGKLDPAQVWPS